ncbi:DUF3035 domain-containing protein [Sneathiella limimaris]|uniref:DUF3035 domain-containing protein n=1 Tax=Sneathiella limimaris TaxID=1964213 RepID=UPI00146F8381|nr:DUF3035 domain-containing protein [Sneathiella limimaris]
MTSSGKIIVASALVAGSMVLSGCEGTRQALGLEGKKAPDEFAVVTKAPLIIPPDFSLRPPSPGQQSPREEAARTSAREALFGQQAPSGVITQEQAAKAGTSAGELALLRQADAVDVDPSIRRIVDEETSVLAEEDKTLIERIMFWQDQPEYGTVVDAEKERKRIQENAALGNSPSDGGDTPTIERKKKALLEGLFN